MKLIEKSQHVSFVSCNFQRAESKEKLRANTLKITKILNNLKM